jgi:tRNA threonylcarbamoyladenosine biosynthesis protein TsaE
MKVGLASEDAMLAFGARFADRLAPGMTVFLSGPLGAGKTTWVRGFLRGHGHEGPVHSPTYTLVESYRLRDLPIHHFDFFRITDPQELELAGVREYFDRQAVCLVEWPERAAGRLAPADLTLSIVITGQVREVTLAPGTPAGRHVLEDYESVIQNK